MIRPVENANKVVGLSKDIMEKVLYSVAPDWLKDSELALKILSLALKTISIGEGIGIDIATGKSTGTIIGNAVSEALYISSREIAKKVFGEMGGQAGAALGSALGPIGLGLGYIIGKATAKDAAKLFVDVMFLEKSTGSFAFGLVNFEAGGYGLKSDLAGAIATLVDAEAVGYCSGYV